ncbi:MAG: hypothetical protein HQM06_07865 [Magnetococcales bacterium]|nr:hypothetical protein [Magnetococcales bacterium]
MEPMARLELSVTGPATTNPQQDASYRMKHEKTSNVEFLSMLALIEDKLCQIADGGGEELLLDSLFRTASDLYRRAAAEGMGEFSDLAYEVAQAFGTANGSNQQAIRRLARLALLAVGQMRRLLIPRSLAENGAFARQVAAQLLNCWV